LIDQVHACQMMTDTEQRWRSPYGASLEVFPSDNW
jgi:hypothetical protein